jgi:hypothetical protein
LAPEKTYDEVRTEQPQQRLPSIGRTVIVNHKPIKYNHPDGVSAQSPAVVLAVNEDKTLRLSMTDPFAQPILIKASRKADGEKPAIVDTWQWPTLV